VGAGISRDMNPSDLSDVVGEYAQADQQQTERAIAAARAAAPGWAAFIVQQRADALDRSAEILARRTSWARCSRARKARPCPRASATWCTPATS
jgi:aldehyde dehydrogenase (NAD+)